MTTDHLKTPLAITSNIQEFARRIAGPDAQPQYVPIRPVPGGEQLDCFVIAERVALERGGKVVPGWRVWEWPGILLEAQAHAVVEMPDRNLLDVSPTHDGSIRDLFVADARNRYVGKRILTRQQAIAGSRTVDKFIAAFHAVDVFEAQHFVDLGPQGAGLSLDDREVRELGKLMEARIAAQLRLARFAARRSDPVPETGRCTCGSGDPVEACHGPRRA